MMHQMMGWKAPYDISAERAKTKRGHDHLTVHGAEVLMGRFEQDSAAMMRLIMASAFGLVPTPDR